MPQVENLHTLLRQSSSTRRLFLSEPVPVQLVLHRCAPFIHSAQDLHRYIDAVRNGNLLI